MYLDLPIAKQQKIIEDISKFGEIYESNTNFANAEYSKVEGLAKLYVYSTDEINYNLSNLSFSILKQFNQTNNTSQTSGEDGASRIVNKLEVVPDREFFSHSFIVTTYNSDGERKYTGGDVIEIGPWEMILSNLPKQSIIDPLNKCVVHSVGDYRFTVEDNKDGTYIVHYRRVLRLSSSQKQPFLIPSQYDLLVPEESMISVFLNGEKVCSLSQVFVFEKQSNPQKESERQLANRLISRMLEEEPQHDPLTRKSIDSTSGKANSVSSTIEEQQPTDDHHSMNSLSSMEHLMMPNDEIFQQQHRNSRYSKEVSSPIRPSPARKVSFNSPSPHRSRSMNDVNDVSTGGSSKQHGFSSSGRKFRN